MEIFSLVSVLSNIATATALICFKRGRSSYKPLMSIIAYLLIVFSGGAAIDTMVNGVVITLWEAGFSVIIAMLVLRARGNVSLIFKGAADVN